MAATLEYQGELQEAGVWMLAFDWQAATDATITPGTAGALPIRVRARRVTAGAASAPGDWSAVRTLTYDLELVELALPLLFPRTLTRTMAMPRTITRALRF